MVELCQLHNSTNSDFQILLATATISAHFFNFYGWGARDRPLRHQHHVGSCVDCPTLADADFLSAFLTLSQRSLRFDPF
ncbi:MAG: hypothetical protein QNK27_05600 [Desulfuromusa sp.]|nr:hypothetical protein [Desulfuromusa sp.]